METWGEFCFNSDKFPLHFIYLPEVMRQSNETLITFIKQLSLGKMETTMLHYARSLSRPIAEEEKAIKLFANNVLVDMFNRECILKVLFLLLLHKHINPFPHTIMQQTTLKTSKQKTRFITGFFTLYKRGHLKAPSPQKISIVFPLKIKIKT